MFNYKTSQKSHPICNEKQAGRDLKNVLIGNYVIFHYLPYHNYVQTGFSNFTHHKDNQQMRSEIFV